MHFLGQNLVPIYAAECPQFGHTIHSKLGPQWVAILKNLGPHSMWAQRDFMW